MPSVQIRSAEFFVQLTAAKHGRRFSRKMKTPAGSTSFSIRTIRTSSSHHFGRRDDSHGFSPVAAQAGDFIDQKIMEWCGNVWWETDSREAFSAKWASPFPERILTAYMQSSWRRTEDSTARITQGSLGP